MDRTQEDFKFNETVDFYRNKFIDSPLGNGELFEIILEAIVQSDRAAEAKIRDIKAVIAAKQTLKAN
ncbi:hypothetical protein MHB43_01000 [Paenibacillus sp. FSL H8-0317]|uniref:hypothetical protein n=1 Tax=Paenibacillus sp. FSL H8-0317 TaxID=2921385 RepID=UPI003248F24B